MAMGWKRPGGNALPVQELAVAEALAARPFPPGSVVRKKDPIGGPEYRVVALCDDGHTRILEAIGGPEPIRHVAREDNLVLMAPPPKPEPPPRPRPSDASEPARHGALMMHSPIIALEGGPHDGLRTRVPSLPEVYHGTAANPAPGPGRPAAVPALYVRTDRRSSPDDRPVYRFDRLLCDPSPAPAPALAAVS